MFKCKCACKREQVFSWLKWSVSYYRRETIMKQISAEQVVSKRFFSHLFFHIFSSFPSFSLPRRYFFLHMHVYFICEETNDGYHVVKGYIRKVITDLMTPDPLHCSIVVKSRAQHGPDTLYNIINTGYTCSIYTLVRDK